ncbi:winged helix DNA-binding protein [Cellulosimicrobium marinum]|uniref:winged helix DNA-binding protein n=1 Tax=Cellulosimicrobium marinum TaxID=1638992 RepID=UPI0027E0FF80|nr:winged helix DNA-binding protein [Cellulosimicrobium marinum]
MSAGGGRPEGVTGEDTGTAPSWTFLTHHAHVLLAVAADPDARVADVAAAVGVTQRTALAVLRDLEDAGYLHRERVGRRTHYTVHPHRPFRHPQTRERDVDDLLAIFAGPGYPSSGSGSLGAPVASSDSTTRDTPPGSPGAGMPRSSGA